MVNSITLTSSMRTNLSSLKALANQMSKTQNILSTGKKVNSAIDNASNYYQARALTNRASDLESLLDSMSQGIQTIQAANEGLTIASNLLEQAKAVAEQALQQTSLDSSLYVGEANTKAIVNQLGADGLAATAANQFYVGSTTGDFGQGTWYLPSIGELMDMYGTDTSAMTSGAGTSGASSYDSSNMKVINDALGALASKDASVAEQMNGGYYWSSSEYSWRFGVDNGDRYAGIKTHGGRVRCFHLLENFFTYSGGNVPQIGDVVYSDKSYGSADAYDGSKTAVGIICDIGADGSVKIVNLKNLRFSSKGSIGNFDANNPYSGSVNYTQWATNAKSSEDITAIMNYDDAALLTAMKSIGSTEVDKERILLDNFGEQYLRILSNYDDMIKDASYQGVNLLNGGRLSVTPNESRNHNLEVLGVDASYNAIGLKTTDWKSVADVEQALDELVDAISKLRDYSESFGNQYQLIQTRQSFTDALIDVLEIGADDLVLADMNEESANYLALQTRQQLATNSLSLAAQSAQSILKLF